MSIKYTKAEVKTEINPPCLICKTTNEFSLIYFLTETDTVDEFCLTLITEYNEDVCSRIVSAEELLQYAPLPKGDKFEFIND